jgi:hypothetical protein
MTAVAAARRNNTVRHVWVLSPQAIQFTEPGAARAGQDFPADVASPDVILTLLKALAE